MIPMVALFAIALVSATVAYFYSTQVDLTVSEARSSEDVAVSLSMLSGETETTDLTISNAANVDLCAELSWEQVENNKSVNYTTNLPQTLLLGAEADTTFTATFTADEVTDAGQVIGKVNYDKVVCPAI
jgi:hypothetical protein